MSGEALGSGDLTPEQLDGMSMWDRDVMLDERHRAVGAYLVRRAVDEIRRHRATVAADEERVRAVVHAAIRYHYDRLSVPTMDAIADRAAKQLAVPVPSRDVPPFTEERRRAVNEREPSGGEVPLPHVKTPEQLAHHIETMVCSFWSWPGNDYSDAELVYCIALGALRRAQEVVACPVHAGVVHGGEAEELRNGIERIIADYVGCEDTYGFRKRMQQLLDRVDARDSLAHLERAVSP